MINCNYNSISLDVRTFCATIHSLTQSIGFVETIELNRFKWFEEGKQKHLKHLNVPTFFLTDTTKFNSKCFRLKLFFLKKALFAQINIWTSCLNCFVEENANYFSLVHAYNRSVYELKHISLIQIFHSCATARNSLKQLKIFMVWNAREYRISSLFLNHV